ncbi:hypothetical protein JD969_13705 [Planctomycetota bacterium]|nr:hypothetical protein JD969_13705 [Planctomycetota bacterium]
MKKKLAPILSTGTYFIASLLVLTLSNARLDAQPEDEPIIVESSTIQVQQERFEYSYNEVATSESQWTGIAITQETSRIFVTFPRWSANVPISVGEVKDGAVVPYPNEEWNNWQPGKDPRMHWICAQSVYMDALDRMWVLDTAAPRPQRTIVERGAKLVLLDPTTNEVVKVYLLGPEVVLPDTYMADVRVDVKNNFAYITDAGSTGAIISLNLKTGEAHRFLNDHYSTSSEGLVLIVQGIPFTRDRLAPIVNVDGIAYDSLNDLIYYQSLTGRTMYRIPAATLRNFGLMPDKVAETVQRVGAGGASDGLFFGPDEKIYITAVEFNAILRMSPNGQVEKVVQALPLMWPNSFTLSSTGVLYFTTSRLNQGGVPSAPYAIYKIDLIQ